MLHRGSFLVREIPPATLVPHLVDADLSQAKLYSNRLLYTAFRPSPFLNLAQGQKWSFPGGETPEFELEFELELV